MSLANLKSNKEWGLRSLDKWGDVQDRTTASETQWSEHTVDLETASPGSASNVTPRKGCVTTARELWHQMSGFQYLPGEWSWVCHLASISLSLGFPGGAVVKNPPAKEMQEAWV